MKTKNLLFGAALLLAACGTSGDGGWKTTDLRYVPLFSEYLDEEGPGEVISYVDTQKGVGVYDTGGGSLYYDGVAVASREQGYYFIDSDQKELFPDTYYADATIFHDGIAWAVKPAGPLTAIDKKGKVLFELKQAETACAFHEGLAAFADTQGKWGLVDKKGRVVVEPNWSDVVPMVVDGLMAVKSEHGKWGLINKKGEIVVATIYQVVGTKNYDNGFLSNYVRALSENRIPVKDDGGKWGIVDRKGNYVINPQFDEILLDGKNYLFRKGRLWGWCDKQGQYIINPQFRDARPFEERDLAAVEDKEGNCGYIDREGKWVINPQFNQAGAFLACGIAPVQDDSSREWGAVDKTGKYVVNPQFKAMYDYGADDKLLVQDQNGYYGIVGADGKYVVAANYSNAPQELLTNVSGIGANYKAKSDFVDVEAIAALIDAKMLTLKQSTTGQLKDAYGLAESKFPKGGGEVTLYKKAETPEVSFKIVVAGLNAWNKKSDGWFGYNYTFNPDVPVDSYTFVVEFNGKGKAWRFVNEIFEVLKKKYPYNEENGTLSVPGYSLVFAAPIPNGGIVFQVKPE